MISKNPPTEFRSGECCREIKRALREDLTASRAECERLREVLRKTKTCNLNTEVRELVNSVLRPTFDQARTALEAK